MADEPLCLISNVIVEPLLDRFFAWPYTVAPVQSAMNLAFLQVPLLESYLQAPQVHVAASGNPELRGGYFVNIAELRADDTGFDLTPLYGKLPPEVSGLVELAYDTGNQAQMRFLEPLAYASDIYQESRQSVQLSFETGIERPFVQSTPRLPSPDVLELGIPFRHPGLEELFKARVHPTTLGHLREALELDATPAEWLSGMLTASPRLAPDRHIDTGGRVRYFGHACLVLQTPQAAIVTDPFISADGSAGDRYSLDDLPDHIELVLITHGHQDHIVFETLLQLRGRIGSVVVTRANSGNQAAPSQS